MSAVKKVGEGFVLIDGEIHSLRLRLLGKFVDTVFDEDTHELIMEQIRQWKVDLAYQNVTVVYGVDSKNNDDPVRLINVKIRYIVKTTQGESEAFRSFRIPMLRDEDV